MSETNGQKGDDLLVLGDVHTHFPVFEGTIIRRAKGAVRAVDGLSLTLRRGEILGLVGESGCGKTTLSRTIMQLVRATSGSIRLEGRELTELSDEQIRQERVNFQMIFQDPFASLNPRMTVYGTLEEAVRTRQPNLKGAALFQAVAALMERVGLSAAQMKKYPHEFSGGQRQRIAIARALAPEPRLILADEPVSALDVSIQSQILNLLRNLCREMGLTMIFISHDLSVVRYIADRVAVMYLGQIVELGEAETVMDNPLHPYTKSLISAIPVPDPKRERARQRLVLTGDPPSPLSPPEGCRFGPRCPERGTQEPPTEVPPFEEVAPGHAVSCCRVCVVPKLGTKPS